LESNNFDNFGQILDEVLTQLGLRQIDLTKIYEIKKSSISTDRQSFLTRRTMMKYRGFMKKHGISENFMLRGIYPILTKQIREQAKAQRTIDKLTLRIEALEEVIEEKNQHTNFNISVSVECNCAIERLWINKEISVDDLISVSRYLSRDSISIMMPSLVPSRSLSDM